MTMTIKARPALLMIGHMYATAFNRRKLNALADYFDITCVTWQIEEGGTLFGKPLADFEQADHEPRYRLIRLPCWPAAHNHTRYFHRHLAPVIRDQSYDLIFVDSEPWSLIRWQTWALTRLIQPKALLGEFSWENILRPGLKGLILGFIYRLACRSHDLSISGNNACRDIFLRYGANPKRNIAAAQLGVEASEFRPATTAEKRLLRQQLSLAIPDEVFLIGFCGRFTDSKGIHQLIAAVSAAREQQPERAIHLALLGHGDLGPMLKKMSETLPWLHLLDPRPHREVAEFMRSLDLFILPSKPVTAGPTLWQEQFGHVLIEAMAARVPTLGSDCGAIPEVIGMSEAIFPHSNAEALTQTLNHWLQNDEGRLALAERQYQHTLQNYSHEALAHTWASFFLACLSKH